MVLIEILKFSMQEWVTLKVRLCSNLGSPYSLFSFSGSWIVKKRNKSRCVLSAVGADTPKPLTQSFCITIKSELSEFPTKWVFSFWSRSGGKVSHWKPKWIFEIPYHCDLKIRLGCCGGRYLTKILNIPISVVLKSFVYCLNPFFRNVQYS